MTYTITVHYYDEPSITDEHDTIEEALDAWTDTNHAAVYAPSSQVGDIRRVILKQGTTILRSLTYP